MNQLASPQGTTAIGLLASFARTALDDPHGLPFTEFTSDVMTDGPRAYAIEKLDAIIDLVDPAEWTYATAAATLDEFSRIATALRNELAASDLAEADRNLIVDDLNATLDHLAGAIGGLRDADGEPAEDGDEPASTRKPHVHVDQADYLTVLHEVGGSAALPDLAEHFDVHEGTARRNLDGLVAQGKVEVLAGSPRVYRLATLAQT